MNVVSDVPLVSVLMPVYNGARYLREAVDSILNQTFRDFEFIIVDDGSTDETGTILRRYTDSRIRLVRNEQNIGMTKSINKGLALAQCEYVARMDADDVSLPERFGKQIAFLTQHPGIGVVGCWVKTIGEDGKVFGGWTYPVTPELVRWMLPFSCPLAHPAVMMRADLVRAVGGYAEEFLIAQDYDLWRRLSSISSLTNLPEYLLFYRSHSSQATNTCRANMLNEGNQISQSVFTSYIGSPNGGDLWGLMHAQSLTRSQATKAARLLLDLYKQFKKRQPLSLSSRKDIRADIGYRIRHLMACCERNSSPFGWNLLAVLFAPGLLKNAIKKCLRQMRNSRVNPV